MSRENLVAGCWFQNTGSDWSAGAVSEPEQINGKDTEEFIGNVIP